MLMFETTWGAVIWAQTEVKKVAAIAAKALVKSILKIDWILLGGIRKMVILIEEWLRCDDDEKDIDWEGRLSCLYSSRREESDEENRW